MTSKNFAQKKPYFFFLLCFLFMYACKTDEKKTENKKTDKQQDKISHNTLIDSLDSSLPIQTVRKFDNGIEINWLQHGTGATIKDEDVILIDYKVRLADSTVIDGNHLLNKASLPYIVGFGFQPPGWDLALKELHIGDFAQIKIPASLARGNKGIKGLIPDNAANFLSIRVLSKQKPTREVDGVKVWLLEENKKNKILFNDSNTIVFHTSISSPSSPFYYNSFAKNEPFTLTLDDAGVVPGLKKALLNAKKGDRMFVLVPAELAYGKKGYLNLVKPGENLFYNLFVLDVLP